MRSLDFASDMSCNRRAGRRGFEPPRLLIEAFERSKLFGRPSLAFRTAVFITEIVWS